MSEDLNPKCDMDDIQCQLMVMGHLQGMYNLLGTEKAQERFPEFADWRKVIEERIQVQNVNIKEAFERCGITPPEPEAPEGEL